MGRWGVGRWRVGRWGVGLGGGALEAPQFEIFQAPKLLSKPSKSGLWDIQNATLCEDCDLSVIVN